MDELIFDIIDSILHTIICEPSEEKEGVESKDDQVIPGFVEVSKAREESQQVPNGGICEVSENISSYSCDDIKLYEDDAPKKEPDGIVPNQLSNPKQLYNAAGDSNLPEIEKSNDKIVTGLKRKIFLDDLIINTENLKEAKFDLGNDSENFVMKTSMKEAGDEGLYHVQSGMRMPNLLNRPPRIGLSKSSKMKSLHAKRPIL